MLVYVFCAADAEVISIDAVVREPNGVIVGVTLVKVCCIRLWLYKVIFWVYVYMYCITN